MNCFSIHFPILGSQICGILWNEEYKELVTGHGFSHNQLTVWKYPAMTKGMKKQIDLDILSSE